MTEGPGQILNVKKCLKTDAYLVRKVIPIQTRVTRLVNVM
jgi:hypothetical protein